MGKPHDERVEQVWAEFLSVLDRLPPTTRAVFLLHVLFDADSADIERTLGVKPAACVQHLGQARRAIESLSPTGDTQ
jgi:DNA-directed RNA polymerase specialized sigma24 family protein